MKKRTKLIIIFSQIAILTTAISVPFAISKKKTNEEINKSIIKKIKDKIIDTNILIEKTNTTSNDIEIIEAIKRQLKIDNPSLTNDDLAKLKDNISSLTPGIQTPVILTITVGSGKDIATDTISITVTKLKTIKEKLENIELQIAKEIATNDKTTILAAIKERLESRTILTSDEVRKITDISISSLTPGIKTSVILTIVDDSINYSQTIFITKSLSTSQVNVAKVKAIKNKINDKELAITKTVDTSDDDKILKAIKNQLKAENTNLLTEDIAKITDNISVLIPGVRTSVTLTITVEGEYDTILIHVTRPKTDQEINAFAVVTIKNKINTNKDLTIAKNVDTSDKTNILNAIKAKLLSDRTLSSIEVAKITNISISSLTPGIPTPVILTITLGFGENLATNTITITLKKLKTIKEKLENIELQIAKETTTNDEATILAAIKERLESRTILTSDEAGKITDISISSLTPGIKTSVTLTIVDDSTNYSQIIFVTKLLSTSQVNSAKVKAIKDKISDKDLTIKKTEDTSNDIPILEAIKRQLKIDNPSLTNDDLAKITDNISSLVSGKSTSIILTIRVGAESDTITIQIIKEQTTHEIYTDITLIKNKITLIRPLEFTITKTSGTVTSNKNYILQKLRILNGYPSDLKGVSIDIENSSTTLTPEGVEFNILLNKTGSPQQKISSHFLIKRTKTQSEINDYNEVQRIKNLIKIKSVVLDKDFTYTNMSEFTKVINKLLKNLNPKLQEADLIYITIFSWDQLNNILKMKIQKGTQKDEIIINFSQRT